MNALSITKSRGQKSSVKPETRFGRAVCSFRSLVFPTWDKSADDGSESRPHREFHCPTASLFTGFAILWSSCSITDGARRFLVVSGPFKAHSIRCDERRVLMPFGNERRRHPRVPVDWPVVIRMKDRTAVGEARNISARGALIQTKRLLHPKEKFRAFLVPANRRAFGVACEVAWVKTRASARKISTYVVGIRFTRLLKGDSQFLLNFIRTQLMPHPDALRVVASL